MRRPAAALLALLVLATLPPLRSSADVCAAPSDNEAPSWLSCDAASSCLARHGRQRGTGTEPGAESARLQRTWLWAVRHGEAEHNLDPVHGWRISDPALTNWGWRQASAAGEQLP